MNGNHRGVNGKVTNGNGVANAGPRLSNGGGSSDKSRRYSNSSIISPNKSMHHEHAEMSSRTPGLAKRNRGDYLPFDKSLITSPNGKEYSFSTVATDISGDASRRSSPGRFGGVLSDMDDFRIDMGELGVVPLDQDDLETSPIFTPKKPVPNSKITENHAIV